MVKPAERIGTLWVIDSGLKAGRAVVVGRRPEVASGKQGDASSPVRGRMAAHGRQPRGRSSAMASFFIRRPIVAIVIAIITCCSGSTACAG
jgi:hypothetical protein